MDEDVSVLHLKQVETLEAIIHVSFMKLSYVAWFILQ